MWKCLLTLLVACLLPSVASAQGHEGHGEASPYAELQARDIKALSAEEVEALLLGDGMGFALAAELNGYPGPKHVLELADSLRLTGEQRRRMDALMQRMQDRARALGRELVEGERALDRAFAAGSIDAPGLEEAVGRLARLRGDLRTVHLAAHIITADLLTEHQRHLYQRLRGYGESHSPGE